MHQPRDPQDGRGLDRWHGCAIRRYRRVLQLTEQLRTGGVEQRLRLNLAVGQRRADRGIARGIDEISDLDRRRLLRSVRQDADRHFEVRTRFTL